MPRRKCRLIRDLSRQPSVFSFFPQRSGRDKCSLWLKSIGTEVSKIELEIVHSKGFYNDSFTKDDFSSKKIAVKRRRALYFIKRDKLIKILTIDGIESKDIVTYIHEFLYTCGEPLFDKENLQNVVIGIAAIQMRAMGLRADHSKYPVKREIITCVRTEHVALYSDLISGDKKCWELFFKIIFLIKIMVKGVYLERKRRGKLLGLTDLIFVSTAALFAEKVTDFFRINSFAAAVPSGKSKKFYKMASRSCEGIIRKKNLIFKHYKDVVHCCKLRAESALFHLILPPLCLVSGGVRLREDGVFVEDRNIREMEEKNLFFSKYIKKLPDKQTNQDICFNALKNILDNGQDILNKIVNGDGEFSCFSDAVQSASLDAFRKTYYCAKLEEFSGILFPGIEENLAHILDSDEKDVDITVHNKSVKLFDREKARCDVFTEIACCLSLCFNSEERAKFFRIIECALCIELCVLGFFRQNQFIDSPGVKEIRSSSSVGIAIGKSYYETWSFIFVVLGSIVQWCSLQSNNNKDKEEHMRLLLDSEARSLFGLLSRLLRCSKGAGTIIDYNAKWICEGFLAPEDKNKLLWLRRIFDCPNIFYQDGFYPKNDSKYEGSPYARALHIMWHSDLFKTSSKDFFCEDIWLINSLRGDGKAFCEYMNTGIHMQQYNEYMPIPIITVKDDGIFSCNSSSVAARAFRTF